MNKLLYPLSILLSMLVMGVSIGLGSIILAYLLY